MENGTGTPVGGSDNRHDTLSRRNTVSEPVRHPDSLPEQEAATLEAMKLPWSSPSNSAPSSPTAPTSPASQKSSGHKRSISGSILQKLNFLRHTPSIDRPPSREKEPPKSPKSPRSRKSTDDDTPAPYVTSPKQDAGGSFALKPVKGRRRTGSLRKTALLGGRKIIGESRERRNSLSAKSPLSKTASQPSWEHVALPDLPNGHDVVHGSNPQPTPTNGAHESKPQPGPRRQFSYEASLASSSTESSWSSNAPAVTAARLSVVTDAKPQQQLQTQDTTPVSSGNELGSPLDLKSPVSQTSYTSTTDDDDILTFDRPTAANTGFANGHAGPQPLSSPAPSYLPAPSTSNRTTTATTTAKKRHHERSPLSHTVSSSSLHALHPDPAPASPSTEHWGWIILLATWLTFTVGMGSCLELWSWAWDVGETPYAPPELEDDPTLPIVGYYPALIVLTVGCVSWCWITVAWVGMKYFRHAKIEV